jgi:hypothetical protein
VQLLKGAVVEVGVLEMKKEGKHGSHARIRRFAKDIALLKAAERVSRNKKNENKVASGRWYVCVCVCVCVYAHD